MPFISRRDLAVKNERYDTLLRYYDALAARHQERGDEIENLKADLDAEREATRLVRDETLKKVIDALELREYQSTIYATTTGAQRLWADINATLKAREDEKHAASVKAAQDRIKNATKPSSGFIDVDKVIGNLHAGNIHAATIDADRLKKSAIADDAVPSGKISGGKDKKKEAGK